MAISSPFFLDLDNWDVLRADFVEGVQYCFENGQLPKGGDAIAVTLAPKTDAPSSMKDYRPIACCSTTYK